MKLPIARSRFLDQFASSVSVCLAKYYWGFFGSVYTGRVRQDFANAVVCVADAGIDHWSIHPASPTQVTGS